MPRVKDTDATVTRHKSLDRGLMTVSFKRVDRIGDLELAGSDAAREDVARVA